MRLSNIVYAAVGYTLGARAGKERYEAIVRVARRVAGSQTVQSTAGVAWARVDALTGHRASRMTRSNSAGSRVNGAARH